MSSLSTSFALLPPSQQPAALSEFLASLSRRHLSHVKAQTDQLLRTDIISELPQELAIRVFHYLDASSLCYAAQVSSAWKRVADDDVLWYRMCEQHIDKKCTKCGWGLPLLTNNNNRKRKASIMLQAPPTEHHHHHQDIPLVTNDLSIHPPHDSHSHTHSHNTTTTITTNAERPWKDIYSERLILERNWRRGRFVKTSLPGHTDGIMCLQINEALSLLITGSYDHTLRVWNTDTWECIKVLHGHTGCVRAVQFDDSKIISGSADHTLRIWSLKTGVCHRVLNYHTDMVVCLFFDHQLLASGSSDHSIKVWNISTGNCFTLLGHTDWVNRVQILNKNRLLSCSDDTTLRLWDLDTLQTLMVFTGHTAPVQCFQIAILQQLSHHASSTNDGSNNSSSGSGATKAITTATSKTSTNAAISTSSSPSPSTATPSFKHHQIITGSLDHTIRVWSLETGLCLKTLFGHEEGVWGISVDRLRIASGGHDGTVRVWDLENGSLMHSFKPFVGAAAAAADRSDDNNNSDINAHRQQEDDVDDNVLRGNNNNNNNTTTSPLNVAVNCCQLTDMKLVAGGDDSLVHVWDFSPYQK